MPKLQCIKRHPYFDRKAESLVVRFWRYVDKRGPDDCWEWMAARKEKGYGTISGRVDGRRKTFTTHRLSFIIHFGPIPPGLSVLHSCDNPPCCNPNHLHAGNALKNSREMMERKRHPFARGVVIARGVTCYQAKLTEDQVRAIRVFYATGNISYKAIGEIFGLTAQAVFYICERKNWRHVQ